MGGPILDSQRHAWVEALMGIIGGPDGAGIACDVDALLQIVDARVSDGVQMS